MKKIVQQLVETGGNDRWIMDHIGMDREGLLRLKQLTGLASLFRDKDFSKAWEWESE